MDIMKQPLHPRVWAWLELAIEAGVDGMARSLLQHRGRSPIALGVYCPN